MSSISPFAMYATSAYPMLRPFYLHNLTESECIDVVIAAIRRSAAFARLPLWQMADYWAEGPDPRIWDALTVFAPAHKVAEAVRLGRIQREEYEYERRVEMCY